MPPPAAYMPRDLRRRAVSLLLSLTMVGLIVLALMRLGVLPTPEFEEEPNSFTLSPDPTTGAPAPEPVAPEAERRSGAAAQATPERAEPAPVEPDPPVPPPVPAPAPFPDILILDREQFAASDIGRRRGTGQGRADDGGGADTGADSAAVYGPGEGPGGERLYNAEWHREPSRAELAGYLPPGGAPPGSWALIACRTVERYEVENCRTLGESPAGSGLARAMRQAAWQFRVRPPRIGGRPQVGAWVRIRISFDAAP